MLNIEEHTTTAGAYILYEGYFLFMFGRGSGLNENELGIVRFGGHRERGETVIECVRREINEETALEAVLFANTDVTYGFNNELHCYQRIDSERLPKTYAPSPILIMNRLGEELSIMYLARGIGSLIPNMETQGILMLRPEDIEIICSQRTTFADFVGRGGKFILTEKLKEVKKNPENFILVPKAQLLFLDQLLKLEPNLIERFFDAGKSVGKYM